jgi:hypothetical protein
MSEPQARARWTERFPVAQLPLMGELLVAIAAAALATVVRLRLDPVLPPRLSFPDLLTRGSAERLPARFKGGFPDRADERTGKLVLLHADWLETSLSWNTAIALGFYTFITTTQVALIHLDAALEPGVAG